MPNHDRSQLIHISNPSGISRTIDIKISPLESTQYQYQYGGGYQERKPNWNVNLPTHDQSQLIHIATGISRLILGYLNLYLSLVGNLVSWITITLKEYHDRSQLIHISTGISQIIHISSGLLGYLGR